jgi:LysM repeat protein
MRSRWGILILLSLLWGIAGCVRTAGTPYEPVDGESGAQTIATDLPTATATPQSEVTEEATALDADAQSDGATATETTIPITLVAPTETPLPLIEITDTATATDLPTNTTAPTDLPTNTDQPTTAPTNTARPTLTTAPVQSQDSADSMVEEETEEPVAITIVPPTGPQGPVPIATRTPIPSATPRPPASDLLPTPTDFGDSGDSSDDTEGDVVVGAEGCTYTVRAGDNAFRIAVNNNVTLEELRAENPDVLSATNPVLQPGDELTIPGCGQGVAVATPTPPPDATIVPPDPNADIDDIEAPEGFITYAVQSGDTLGSIASRNGTTIAELVEINDLTDPDRLSIGQVLFVPDPNASPPNNETQP